jgi:hypothetical protein
MTGRKTKLNKETIQLIGNMAEKGCDNKTICDILGIKNLCGLLQVTL